MNLRARDYFPLGLAEGEAFCNRTHETNVLIDNIKNVKHSLLVATRKYGKSSLVLHTLTQSNIPYSEIDFFLARDENTIETYILNGVIDLIGKTFGSFDKLLSSIKRYAKHLKPKLEIAEIVKLEFTTDNTADPATNVKEALILLEKLLAEKNKQAVLWMDEFQSVGQITKGSGIEAAIRHVAQKTKHLMFIFSGSHRRLLLNMFEDDTKPLYKLCWKIELTRISVEHYHHHLQKIANLFWKQLLSEEVIAQIFLLSERHPFYLNKLCDRIWSYCINKPPTEHDIHTIWQEIIVEEKSDIVKEISLLSPNQKTILIHIAKGNAVALTTKEVLLELKMTSSSTLVALQSLEEKDIIEKNEVGYQIINPIIKFYALKNGTSKN